MRSVVSVRSVELSIFLTVNVAPAMGSPVTASVLMIFRSGFFWFSTTSSEVLPGNSSTWYSVLLRT